MKQQKYKTCRACKKKKKVKDYPTDGAGFFFHSCRQCKNKKDKESGQIRWSNFYHRNSSGRKRQIPVDISRELFFELTNQRCFYCNRFSIPVSYSGDYGKKDYLSYVGIDRIDSSKGYTPDNCVSCCNICNSAKSTLSQEKFYEHIKTIYGHLKEKELL